MKQYIDVKTLHSEVRFNINLLNSNYDQAINTIDIDIALNRAKDYFIQNYSFLVEKSKFYEENLKELQILDKIITPSISNESFDSFTLPEDYYTYQKITAVATKDTCTDLIWNTYYKSSNKISLEDPNWQPSFFWRTGLYDIYNKGIAFYHNKDYAISHINLSYIKKVPDVQAPSLTTGGQYEKADGSVITEDKHLQIYSTALWRKITELAAYYILKSKRLEPGSTLQDIVFTDSIGVNIPQQI